VNKRKAETTSTGNYSDQERKTRERKSKRILLIEGPASDRNSLKWGGSVRGPKGAWRTGGGENGARTEEKRRKEEREKVSETTGAF